VLAGPADVLGDEAVEETVEWVERGPAGGGARVGCPRIALRHGEREEGSEFSSSTGRAAIVRILELPSGLGGDHPERRLGRVWGTPDHELGLEHDVVRAAVVREALVEQARGLAADLVGGLAHA
jgi:hypothetical protein